MNLDDLFQILKADANTANALGAIASAVLALFALLVSIFSVYVSLRALRIQRRHNILSVSPLPEITVADYENSLRLKIRNNGTGPLIIQKVLFSKNDIFKNNIMEWMPRLPEERPWTTFSHSLVDRTIQSNGELIILELTKYENETEYATCRDLTRAALTHLVANVHYTDIYHSQFNVYTKKLDWFGRNLNIIMMNLYSNKKDI
jgi:hypothetical protein